MREEELEQLYARLERPLCNVVGGAAARAPCAGRPRSTGAHRGGVGDTRPRSKPGRLVTGA